MLGSNLAGLRLAVLAPIARALPPDGYGPWEQVAFNIAQGMRRRGLDVTLFASGNSRFAGSLAWVVPVGLDQEPLLDADVLSALHIGNVFRHAGDFDLIHNNLDWKPLTYALATEAPPMLTTIHGFSSPQILAPYYAAAGRSFYCSISNADRDPGLAYLATTYNGIDLDSFTFVPARGDYLVFLGRFHEEKGAHLAIEIARRAGIRLKMAGVVHDERYFRERIAPAIDGDHVEFLGPVAGGARDELLGNALGLVHMTTRPERFGLVLVEAMACGTPVLGARMGSIPEIVVDGVTGVLCDGVDQAVRAAGALGDLDRAACRARVEEEFSVDRMVDRYLEAYAAALRLKKPEPATQDQLAARASDWWQHPMAFTDTPPRPASIEIERSLRL